MRIPMPRVSRHPTRRPLSCTPNSPRGGAPILRASDGPPGGSSLQPGTNFSVAIDCDSVEEIERLFGAVGQNGKIRMPLSNVPWGARFGMLTDQFGIQWMFNCNLPK